MCFSEDHQVTNQSAPGANDMRMKKHFPISHASLKKSSYQIQPSSPRQTKLAWSVLEFVGGLLLAVGTVLFSLWFPFFLTPKAAAKTYQFAFYHYDPALSLFDNTFLTYGTDYFLAIAMTFWAYYCVTASTSIKTRPLRLRAAGLLLCYAFSVLAGGWAHQFYTTVESRNSLKFRILWTICVGTVTAAGGFMGMCASEVSSKFANRRIVPEILWVGFGVGTTLICIAGGVSFQRPACDIFIAGQTQIPPTAFFMVLFVYTMMRSSDGKPCPIGLVYKLVGLVGFILNAPLLPTYACMVQYTSWSLGEVNALLHSNLLVAWSMQALTLRQFVAAMDLKEKR